jgi:hypothetical protein
MAAAWTRQLGYFPFTLPMQGIVYNYMFSKAEMNNLHTHIIYILTTTTWFIMIMRLQLKLETQEKLR